MRKVPVQRLRREADGEGALGFGSAHQRRQTLFAAVRKPVERGDADQIDRSRHGENLLGHVARSVAQREFADQGLDPLEIVVRARLHPLPLRLVLPLAVVERELAQLAGPAVPAYEHRLRLVALLLRLVHRAVDIDADLVGQEIDQRQMLVTIDAQIHRHAEEGQRQQHLDGLERENPVRAVAQPHHEGHRQQHQVLGERLPRRELERLAEAAAVLHRDPRGAQERQQREKCDRHQREDRHQPDPHLAQQHAPHHQLGAAEPDRKRHAPRAQELDAVDRQVFVDLQRSAPRVDHLQKARDDERTGQDDTADGRRYPKRFVCHAVYSDNGASAPTILAKIASGVSIAPDASLQSTTSSRSSSRAAARYVSRTRRCRASDDS